MSLSIKNANLPTPANVGKFVAAVTFICQGVPPIIESSGIITSHTKELISLVFDLINVAVAAIAVMYGSKE
jgi:hypothetical protein